MNTICPVCGLPTYEDTLAHRESVWICENPECPNYLQEDRTFTVEDDDEDY